MSATMGCVVGIWSCTYAQALRRDAKVTHAVRKSVASSTPRAPI